MSDKKLKELKKKKDHLVKLCNDEEFRKQQQKMKELEKQVTNLRGFIESLGFDLNDVKDLKDKQMMEKEFKKISFRKVMKDT